MRSFPFQPPGAPPLPFGVELSALLHGVASHHVVAHFYADLQRSGLFDPLAVTDMIDRPSRPPEVKLGTWRLLKVDYVAMGRWIPGSDGLSGEIEYHLVAVHSGRTLFSRVIAAVTSAMVRS